MARLGNGVEDWIGKRVSIIFDDGSRIVTRHGILRSISDGLVFVKTNGKEEAISMEKIVRMELEQ